MIAAREIVYSLYGAYRLCRFDPQGLAYFNPTLEGFWRSFVAALIVAPAHCLLTIINLRDVAIEASLARVVAIETLAYVILVFAYPLVVFHICQMMGRSERYFTYIVAYNWAGVIQIALILPATALGASDLLPLNLAYAIGHRRHPPGACHALVYREADLADRRTRRRRLRAPRSAARAPRPRHRRRQAGPGVRRFPTVTSSSTRDCPTPPSWV